MEQKEELKEKKDYVNFPTVGFFFFFFFFEGPAVPEMFQTVFKAIFKGLILRFYENARDALRRDAFCAPIPQAN